MRNLTFQEWAYTMITLLLLGWAGSIFESQALGWIVLICLLALTVERVLNLRRIQRERARCGQYIESHSGARSHLCELPRDGHTTHRCGHGDCSWGS